MRTVPGERKSWPAIDCTGEPSSAWRSTSRSRSVKGFGPPMSDSVASAGSTTRSPASTRRTASASSGAGVSLTTKPLAPASIARRR
ncbi:hypothetical protein BJF80_09960 [Serinicoccus sp. CUA-874]|nr:hypothetical protein BJF80_09960 [Serinicoccus sp. CUA-874]